MNTAAISASRAFPTWIPLLIPLALIAVIAVAAAQSAAAEPPEPAASEDAAATMGLPAIEDDPPSNESIKKENAVGEPSEDGAGREVKSEINIFELLAAGGHLMWPILAMSLLVVIFGVERLLGLRRFKVLPPELIAGLENMVGKKGGLDPRQTYKLCQQYPSAAANVIKTMLLKVGRPHAEVERAVSDAKEREADWLYANVRWLGLAAGVTPLLGLFGTVWGMILAFFTAANLPAHANKSVELAGGIYVALVTTFAALAVAIPAAVLAHFFEGWIQRLFRELDETILGLLPQLERFEGQLRVSRDQVDRWRQKQRAAEPTPDRSRQRIAAKTRGGAQVANEPG